MKAMIKRITLAIIIMLSAPIWAQQAGQVVSYKAQMAVIDEATNMTTLSGDVSLKRGNLDMKADEIEIFSETKENGEEDFKTLNAQGNIVATSGARTITSEKMTYNAQTEIAVFTENVSIKTGQNTAKGVRAEVNMATGVHRLFGPVSGTISGTLP